MHKQLIELSGTPAFEVRLGDARDTAPSFEALRQSVLGVAQKGTKLQRFKGLGEMNAEQLDGHHDGPREPVPSRRSPLRMPPRPIAPSRC